MVAVALHGRAFGEVVSDMVDGIIVANHLEGEAATRMRSTLLHAVAPSRTSAAA